MGTLDSEWAHSRGAYGVGVLAAVAASHTEAVAGVSSTRAQALNEGSQAGLIGATIIVFVAPLLAAVLLPREPKAKRTPTPVCEAASTTSRATVEA